MKSDADHIQKFIDCLGSDYEVKFYKSSGYCKENGYRYESRVFITDKHMCPMLYEHYGMVPNRHDISSVLNEIPKYLEKYFVLGCFDADGSFAAYRGDYGEKLSVMFGGSIEMLDFIQKHLVENNVTPIARTISGERKYGNRHKGKDGAWRTLNYSGKHQGMKILDYLYQDAPIYLDRKYQKYLNLPYHNK